MQARARGRPHGACVHVTPPGRVADRVGASHPEEQARATPNPPETPREPPGCAALGGFLFYDGPMTQVVRFHEKGGPEVLRVEEVEVGAPGPGQARVRHRAIGVNFLDTYHRTGLYPLPLPSGIGAEGAGVVEAVGEGVRHVSVGERVAYAGGPPGSYAVVRLIPADRLVRVPEGISDEQAAAMMLKGLTVQYLIRRTYRVKAGETVLWHAAAGGVGLIACQWLKALGVKVIGTAGSDEKAQLARRHGAEHVVVYTRESFPDRVKQLTGGEGVPVVYDSVGKSTFAGSLDCLRPLGLLVSFGNASGAVPPFDLGVLAQKGSLYVTRPTLNTYAAKREDLEAMAAELFDVVRAGHVKIEIGRRYPLAEAARAHRDLEARATTGSVILTP
jgi:NADPH2:quinone reductase